METDERLLTANDSVGALGVRWDPQTDTLALKVALMSERSFPEALTKRSALSEAARLFDPLGWAAPVLIFAKVFLQDLWLRGCKWDDPLATELASGWEQFRASLHQLNEVRIPRWVHFGSDTVTTELHGFSDASERAYAAVIYLRIARSDGNSAAHLLVARTRVAPVKTQSIPRLELCGAVLLARLLTRVAKELEIPPTSVFAWTDARVVLCWISSHASRWKPFVAHRIAEIQGLLPSERWNHVRTTSNPADLATRGVSPSDILNRDLWWHGPDWLGKPRKSWPETEATNFVNVPEDEQRTKLTAVHLAQASPTEEILERFSSLIRLLRITAYCFRFFHNLRNPLVVARSPPTSCSLVGHSGFAGANSETMTTR
nr:PREDICTED: uncharacterized protein LOC105667924 [Linepithema humile]